MNDSSVVLLFIKSPEKGKVKSRLAKEIGEDMALDVYKYLVRDTLETLQTSEYAFRLYFYPPDSEASVKNWLGCAYSYVPQHGRDLGERMRNAFAQEFSEGRDKVVLIGSDIPGLSASLINEAFTALVTSDAVIGPANDGGYYLIGFNSCSFWPDIFRGIVWSTDSVYYETMNIFDKSGLSVYVLAGLTDVDTYEDLKKTGYR
jgi:rSAM/selenodomain-associated transferase 1